MDRSSKWKTVKFLAILMIELNQIASQQIHVNFAKLESGYEQLESCSTMKEDSSLLGVSNISCAIRCAELQACHFFSHVNSRCVLIGDGSLLGQDFSLGVHDLEAVYHKEDSGISLNYYSKYLD